LSLSLRFPHQNPIYVSPLPIRATCPARLILLDFITQTILGETDLIQYNCTGQSPSKASSCSAGEQNCKLRNP
jgi:hypothetical protein